MEESRRAFRKEEPGETVFCDDRGITGQLEITIPSIWITKRIQGRKRTHARTARCGAERGQRSREKERERERKREKVKWKETEAKILI